MLKTPKFWYRDVTKPPSILEYVLWPFCVIYKLAYSINTARKTTNTAPLPIICIGNITAGGSGKTPTAISINELIIKNELFKTPFFLTRGYGGTNKDTRCISVHDDASDVGDEALLLVNHSKTIVSVMRHKGAMMAYELGAGCIIMDDGFQNPTLKKDISILVIDGQMGFGNGKLLPAGPLREPPHEAFKRTDAIIFIGDDHRGLLKTMPTDIPIFKASIRSTYSGNKKSAYIGFAGLAQPQKFLKTLKDENFNVIAFKEFPDHHPYSSSDIEKLFRQAASQNATLITTEKDMIKIPRSFHDRVETLPIKLHWQNEEDIVRFLSNKKSSLEDKR